MEHNDHHKEDNNGSKPNEETERGTFRRDENGILWYYDANGNKIGRMFEHGID